MFEVVLRMRYQAEIPEFCPVVDPIRGIYAEDANTYFRRRKAKLNNLYTLSLNSGPNL